MANKELSFVTTYAITSHPDIIFASKVCIIGMYIVHYIIHPRVTNLGHSVRGTGVAWWQHAPLSTQMQWGKPRCSSPTLSLLSSRPARGSSGLTSLRSSKSLSRTSTQTTQRCATSVYAAHW